MLNVVETQVGENGDQEGWKDGHRAKRYSGGKIRRSRWWTGSRRSRQGNQSGWWPGFWMDDDGIYWDAEIGGKGVGKQNDLSYGYVELMSRRICPSSGCPVGMEIRRDHCTKDKLKRSHLHPWGNRGPGSRRSLLQISMNSEKRQRPGVTRTTSSIAV